MRSRKRRSMRSVLPPDLRRYYSEGGCRSVFRSLDVPLGSPGAFEVEFCQDILARAPEHFETLALLGEAYVRRGDYEKSLETDLRLIGMRPESSIAHYNLACSYALNRNKEEALQALLKAVARGYNDVEHLRQDRDLKILHTDPRFQTLVKKLRRKKSRSKA
ncbi:MAG: tetratricopeptide repeat protein [Planctomycetes bacterium]|nr:tetratricopeptide repeat protein [Planctomycetota bacterium]